MEPYLRKLKMKEKKRLEQEMKRGRVVTYVSGMDRF